MSEVPAVTGEQAVAVFCRFGFSVVRIKGSHHIMKKPGHRFILSIPVHKGAVVKKGTLRAQITCAGISVAQFVESLG